MGLTSPAGIGTSVATADVARRITGRKADVRSAVFEATLLSTLVLSVVILIALVLTTLQDGWPVLSNRLGDFLSSGPNTSSAATAGIWAGIKGTLIMSVIVAIVAFPLGVSCAIYLEEYASKSRFARLTQINVRNLAGVPSIVYGLLGLSIFVRFAKPVTNGQTVISGGLTLAVLVLPIVVITASEALRAVPLSIREGAFGVGATKWEVIRSHVLPSAAPGILTGTVLSLARAAGEAAPLLLVGAVTGFLSTGDQGIIEQITEGRFTALPAQIFAYARVGGGFSEVTAAASVVLIALVFLVNALAIWLRNRYEQKW
jgi:phosphate transport system permease protein